MNRRSEDGDLPAMEAKVLDVTVFAGADDRPAGVFLNVESWFWWLPPDEAAGIVEAVDESLAEWRALAKMRESEDVAKRPPAAVVSLVPKEADDVE